jgi:hypothetical protein
MDSKISSFIIAYHGCDIKTKEEVLKKYISLSVKNGESDSGIYVNIAFEIKVSKAMLCYVHSFQIKKTEVILK